MANGLIKYHMIDISRWSTIRAGFFAYLWENGYTAVILRLNNGSLKDPTFDERFDQCREEAPEMLIGFYSWPNETFSVETSMNYIIGFLGDRYVDFAAIDVESPYYSGSWTLLKEHCFQLYGLMTAYFGTDFTLFYTGVNSSNQIGPDLRWNDIRVIWLALYYSNLTIIPDQNQKPWRVGRYFTLDQVGLWQCYPSWRIPAEYSPSGLDLNLGYEELDPIYNVEFPPPYPEPEDWFFGHVLVDSLNVRSGSGIEFEIVGYFFKDQEMWARNIEIDWKNDSIWIETSPNRWCAARYNGNDLVEGIFESELPPPDPDPIPDPPPEPEPDPIPDPEIYGQAEVRGRSKSKPWSVAWTITTYNGDVPIIETNAFGESGDPKYKFPKDTILTVAKGVVVSDGGTKWHRIFGLYYEDRDVFIRKDEMMKLW